MVMLCRQRCLRETAHQMGLSGEPLPTSTATPVLLNLAGSLLRPLEDTPHISRASDNPFLPLMYWLGREANDQILDPLNARLDQSPQLGRIQAWRVFRSA